MARKKVLLLGGAGFIGTFLARFLLRERDHEITIADTVWVRDLDEHFSAEQKANITFIDADFLDPAAFDLLQDDYDYVYMLASVVGVNPTLEHPEEVIRINTTLITNTLAWLRTSSVGKVLFCSSSECYAGTTQAFDYPVPTGEEVPLCIDDITHPRWTYAVTKMLGESAFLNSGPKYGFDACVVRYQNAFGPDMGFKHAIPHIIERFYKGESPVRIFGTDQTRAFCYITDSAEGTVLAMESDAANGEVFHIGSMVEISMDTLTRAVGKIVGYTGEYVDEETYPGSVARRCPDISKARRLLDYEPKVHWEEGLRRTVAWYLEFFGAGKVPSSGGFEPPENFKPQRKG